MACLAAAAAMWSAAAQVPHTLPSPLFEAMPDAVTLANGATQLERERPAGWDLAEHRRLSATIAGLGPQRPGVVDAYVVVAALDSDGVFRREAREAARVLARRYGAAGRTALLAGGDTPHGAPDALAAVLARVAELADAREDALILYLTAHGTPFGIVYADGNEGYGALSPYWLWTTLTQLKLTNRLLILNACFSGIFAPVLASDAGVVVTAAAADRTSFGCVSENDWTFFGDALINHALRKPQPIAAAFAEARTLVDGWEARVGVTPSDPRAAMGPQAAWLGRLEARLPAATAPVGRSAAEALPGVIRKAAAAKARR